MSALGLKEEMRQRIAPLIIGTKQLQGVTVLAAALEETFDRRCLGVDRSRASAHLLCQTSDARIQVIRQLCIDGSQLLGKFAVAALARVQTRLQNHRFSLVVGDLPRWVVQSHGFGAVQREITRVGLE